ncbi:MAG: 6-carboxytetrahydropterin synthase [Terriglobia bacterium]
MIYLTRRYRFSASHRLHNPRLPEEENRRIYGKCNNEGGHGHNYALEVTVAGEPDPRTGMVVSLAELDGIVEREILERYDLANLNADRESFADQVPTTENLCREIFRRLRRGFRPAPVTRVRLEETSLNAFEIREESGESR